ncbi:prepilin-type N-terminal cleavage/methylation domain-containing protein [Herbaspirillum sp. SJZ107]|uniref:prepilin-type N-terminal cleavage/methylation domain-containing protein n=1 Tax=Herbaspirillum sp. SJZ107 TaxID=2572881 RepID=UPI001C89352A|nr:prepilin-type N-terminal cleavage/methylation domain-containing protein [Herbaspirillum sp. SJZ107]
MTQIKMRTQNMSSVIKRSVARGFTLIELLIVVIILAILAAIAIPQFSSSTVDAQLSALDSNLATVRSAIEQYRVQHNGNVYPGAVAVAGGTVCPNNGGNSVAAAVGEAALRAQLSMFTNAAGEACPTGDTTFRFGPYLRQGIPTEPFSNSNAVTVPANGAAPVAVAAGLGWAYSTGTGQFIKNNTAADGGVNNRPFNQH